MQHKQQREAPTYLLGPEIFKESEDEMKTLMMIMTKKTIIVHHGNLTNHQNPLIWTLWSQQN